MPFKLFNAVEVDEVELEDDELEELEEPVDEVLPSPPQPTSKVKQKAPADKKEKTFLILNTLLF